MQETSTQEQTLGFNINFTFDELLILNYIISNARREKAEKYHDYDDEHGLFVMEQMKIIDCKIDDAIHYR